MKYRVIQDGRICRVGVTEVDRCRWLRRKDSDIPRYWRTRASAEKFVAQLEAQERAVTREKL